MSDNNHSHDHTHGWIIFFVVLLYLLAGSSVEVNKIKNNIEILQREIEQLRDECNSMRIENEK